MKKFIAPLTVFAVTTVIFGTIYGTAQQVLRQSANDPQVQMAEDAANSLNNGASMASVLTPKVDVNKSLAPFIMLYDKKGNLVGSAVYNGLTPLKAVPFGVLKNAGQTYHAITWQPEPNIRIASVSVEADQYYVLTGRSLKEIEGREDRLMRLVALGWFVAMLVIITAYWLLQNPSVLKKLNQPFVKL